MLDPYAMEIRWQHLRDAFLAILAEGTCQERRLGRAPKTSSELVRQHLDERWTRHWPIVARHSEAWHRARMRREERLQRGIARRAASAAACERRTLARIESKARAVQIGERRCMAAEEARQKKYLRLSDRLAKRERRWMLEEDRASRQAEQRGRLERRRVEQRRRRAERQVSRTESAIDRLLRRWLRLEAAKENRRKQKARFDKAHAKRAEQMARRRRRSAFTGGVD
eukprot:TRINITY_DN19264_c1_g2_i6.p1 TRINITY_DN19264_c1_g2~~TRINITY_DN19264_c1_g2_i6.p1  ORF type:complete len:251 (+),score=27.78 TRINITY_DN19264_c1_g2_i6:73-753(+)